MDDERRLVAMARRGDADAFEALAAPLEGMVYNHCLFMLRHTQDAQDAAQEAMLRAYRAMPRFIGASRFSTWLYRIAHNTCLDFIRARRARGETESLDAIREAGFEPPSREQPPDEQTFSADDEKRIRSAVSALPDDMRVLIEMYHGGGFGYEDMAKALGISVGTVKSRLSRARERLKRSLGSE